MAKSNERSTSSNPMAPTRRRAASAGGGHASVGPDEAREPPRCNVRRTPATRRNTRSPCRTVLREAERRTADAGHENDGFLSWSHGFIPKNAPLRRLAPQFAAWDELAGELPTLYRDLTLRRRVEQLPLLDASEGALEDRQVLRACALLAIVAQAYWYVEVGAPEVLPEVIEKPWAQLRRRLGREQQVLSYIDLIVYNWRVVDPSLPEPLLVDNLKLLLPTVDNREEHVFYLTQLEILAKASPIVRLVTLAQDAVLVEDQEALEEALLGVISLLTHIVRTSLPKINPSPFGATHVDPVVWAKTVAPFAVPMRMGDQGPSGTSSPLFNTLDLFFGRRDYGSFLGREIRQLRATYPPAWRAFLEAIGRVSVEDYIERTGSKALAGAWREAFDLYVGPSGFLGRHRMKVYGYLELAFKVGRSVTIGGFGGVFKDRTWDQVDNELEASQRERLRAFPSSCPEARVQSQPSGSCPVAGGVRHLTLDISRAGVRYGVGDRCIIFPENGPELVALTLGVLAARGDERVALTDEWREAGNVRRELSGKAELPVRDVLRFGCIRPVTPRIAEALHARTQSGLLLEQLQRCCTERWELWELIELLRAEGLNPVDLWSEPGVKVSERLCRIIPPERFRVYSIASATPSPLGKPATSIDLIVGHLRYPGPGDALAALARATARSERPSGCPVMSSEPLSETGAMREGTASSFLARAERDRSSFPFRIERPARFQLPADTRAPIIFFAGGTGVSPFLGFLQERLRSAAGGLCWLFWSLRNRQDFVCDAELGPALRAGLLELDVCFTREGAEVQVDPAGHLRVREGSARRIAELMRAPAAAHRLWELLAPDDGQGASVYVCGRSGFARSVLDGLKSVFREFATGSDSERAERANEMLYRLVANNRLLMEIHTDAQPADDEPRWIDISEVAEHNCDGAGYWMIIDRVVYDLTEFMELHPGGRRVVQAYAGLDATHGYARAHHQRPEVDAMREMYRIGMVRALEFDEHTTQIEGPSGPLTISCRTAHVAWLHALQLVVEMQNALRADYSLQECVTTSGEAAEQQGRYKLSRAAETHCRFLEHYQRVLEEETLPNLWRISQGLFAPEVSADWMSQELSLVRASSLGQEMHRLAYEVLRDFTAFAADMPRLQRMLGTFQTADLSMLAELKRVLASGVRVFERHQKRTRTCGSAEIRATSRALVDVFKQSTSSLAVAMGASQELPTAVATFSVCASPARVARRVYSSAHWVFEERADESLAVLQRTPVAWTSLAQLSEENEAILESLGEHQRNQGLLVDMREAPIRNDADFENAMAKLRQGLTNHFKRMAILLESNLGELQVTRIERDERRNALATRSESSALKFLLGGK